MFHKTCQKLTGSILYHYQSRKIEIGNIQTKLFSTTSQNKHKVTLIGACGGIGQPLGLILKRNPLVSCLALYDVSKTVIGVAEDLSHINNINIVEGYEQNDLGNALDFANVVVFAAGKPRKEGMTRQDLFKINAQLVSELTQYIVKHCPNALIAVITNPVNSLVPVVDSVMEKGGHCAGQRIFGVTTLDLVRASTFVGEAKCVNPKCLHVPVIGGHSGTTIIPLLSQCDPPLSFSEKEAVILTKRIQNAGTEVVKAKAGAGSATLSTAFAAARFVDSLLKGLSNYFKVAVIGAAGEFGQTLGMLLKLNPNVTKLALFDPIKATPGIGVDISHINNATVVEGRNKKKELYDTLIGATIVVLALSRLHRRGSRQDELRMKADRMFDVLRAIVAYCPHAFIVVMTRPLNTMLPLVSEYMEKACAYDPKRIFGVTTLHQIRAATFVGKTNYILSSSQYVPVIGGNEGHTIIPLISQSTPPFIHGIECVKYITYKVQSADKTVADKKLGKGSAVLAPAVAAEQFIDLLMKALMGQRVIACALVRSDVTDAKYFATPLILGSCGIEESLGIGRISDFEKQLIEKAVPLLNRSTKDAIKYINRKEKLIVKAITQ